MKIEIDITGTLRIDSEKEIVVDLFSNGVKLDWFELNYKHKEINVELSKDTGKILGINVTEYLDYMKLIEDLGLKIPKSYRRHWTPKTEPKHYYIDFEGDICPNGISSNFGFMEVDRRRCENFNMFPTKELAEKAVNLSKLDRLILLWQYANDCLFVPDWKDGDTKKYFIRYDYIKEEVCHGYNVTIPSDTLYFKTEEQVKTFIEMYETEIKKIMGVI